MEELNATSGAIYRWLQSFCVERQKSKSNREPHACCGHCRHRDLNVNGRPCIHVCSESKRSSSSTKSTDDLSAMTLEWLRSILSSTAGARLVDWLCGRVVVGGTGITTYDDYDYDDESGTASAGVSSPSPSHSTSEPCTCVDLLVTSESKLSPDDHKSLSAALERGLEDLLRPSSPTAPMHSTSSSDNETERHKKFSLDVGAVAWTRAVEHIKALAGSRGLQRVPTSPSGLFSSTTPPTHRRCLTVAYCELILYLAVNGDRKSQVIPTILGHLTTQDQENLMFSISSVSQSLPGNASIDVAAYSLSDGSSASDFGLGESESDNSEGEHAITNTTSVLSGSAYGTVPLPSGDNVLRHGHFAPPVTAVGGTSPSIARRSGGVRSHLQGRVEDEAASTTTTTTNNNNNHNNNNNNDNDNNSTTHHISHSHNSLDAMRRQFSEVVTGFKQRMSVLRQEKVQLLERIAAQDRELETVKRFNEQLRDRNRRLEVCQDQCADLQRANKGLEQRVEQYQRYIEQTKAQCDSLRERLADSEGRYAVTQAQAMLVQDKQMELSQSTSQLRLATRRIQELQQKSQLLEEELRAARSQASRLNQSSLDSSDSISMFAVSPTVPQRSTTDRQRGLLAHIDSDSSSSDGESEQGTHTRTAEEWAEEMKVREAQILHLQKKLYEHNRMHSNDSEVQEEVVCLREVNQSLTEQVIEKSEAAAELEEACSSYQTELLHSADQISWLQYQVETLAGRTSDPKVEVPEHLCELVTRLRSGSERKDDSGDKKGRQRWAAQSSFSAVTQRLHALTERFQKLQREHMSVSKQHQQLTKTHDVMKEEHKTLAESHQSLEQAHNGLKSDHQALVTQREKLTRDLKELQDAHTLLETTHQASLTRSKQQVESQREQSRAAEEAMEQQVQSLSAQLTEMRERTQSSDHSRQEALSQANQEVARLTNELAETQDKLSAVQSELSDTRAHAQDVQTQLSAAEEHSSELTRRLDETHSDLQSRLSRADSEMKTALKQAQDQLAQSQAQGAAQLQVVQGDLTRSETSLVEARQEIESMHGQLAACQTQLRTSQSQLAATQADLQRAEGEVAALRTEASGSHKLVTQLRAQLSATAQSQSLSQSELEGALQTAQTQTRSLETRLAALQESYQTASEHTARKQCALQEAEASLQSLTALHDSAKERLAQREEELTSARSELETAARAQRQARRQARSLQAQLGETREECELSVAQAEARAQSLAVRFKDQAVSHAAELQRWQAEKEQEWVEKTGVWEHRMEALQDKNQELGVGMQEFRDKNQEWKDKCGQSEEECSRLREASSQLEAQLTERQQSLETCQKALTDKSEQCRSLDHALHNTRTELSVSRGEVASLRARVKALRSHLDSHRQHHQDITQRLQAIRSGFSESGLSTQTHSLKGQKGNDTPLDDVHLSVAVKRRGPLKAGFEWVRIVHYRRRPVGVKQSVLESNGGGGGGGGGGSGSGSGGGGSGGNQHSVMSFPQPSVPLSSGDVSDSLLTPRFHGTPQTEVRQWLQSSSRDIHHSSDEREFTSPALSLSEFLEPDSHDSHTLGYSSHNPHPQQQTLSSEESKTDATNTEGVMMLSPGGVTLHRGVRVPALHGVHALARSSAAKLTGSGDTSGSARDESGPLEGGNPVVAGSGRYRTGPRPPSTPAPVRKR